MSWGLPFDLSEFARRMAEMNISPEALMPVLSPHLGSLVSPTGQMVAQANGGLMDSIPTNESFPGAREELNNPDSTRIDNFFKSLFGGAKQIGSDLMEPIPTNSSMQTIPPVAGESASSTDAGQRVIQQMLNPAPMSGEAEAPGLGDLMLPTQIPVPAVKPANNMQVQMSPVGTSVTPMQTTGTGPKQLRGGTPFEAFMGTVQAGGVNNPNALAAIAATGSRESRWDQDNIGGSWSDRSQSGQPGISGGAMSWRGPRFRHLQDFAKSNGLDPKDAATQAKFFLSEDPVLIQRLNQAKSPQEAQKMMNDAWAFAGYDNPNSAESKARFAEAEKYAGMFNAGGTGSWTSAMNNVQDTAPVDDATGGALTGPTGHEPTATGKKPFGQRLGELGKSLKDPTGRPKPPTGTAPLPQPGNYRPDPNSMALILQMLSGGAGGGVPQVGPTLGQLLGAVGGMRRG